MQYSTAVDKDYDTLKMLIEEAGNFEKENVLHAVSTKLYTVEDVKALTFHIRENQYKLEKEVLALEVFSKKFPFTYATKNNKCFDTVTILLNRMRQNISGTKKLYKRFCLTNRKHEPVKDGKRVKPSAFAHSQLNHKLQIRQLFGMEVYDDCVSELCDAMEDFFFCLHKGLLISLDTIKLENMVRNDDVMLKYIYDAGRDKVMQNLPKTIFKYISNDILNEDELAKRKANAKSLQEFIRANYHTVDEESFKIHAIVTAISEGRQDGLTGIETLLWGDNPEFVKKVRFLIAHFDELNPGGYSDNNTKKKKLKAKYVAMFMKWCRITATGNEKKFIEEYFNVEYHGNYECVGSSSVNSAKNKFSDEEYNDFLALLKRIYMAVDGNKIQPYPQHHQTSVAI